MSPKGAPRPEKATHASKAPRTVDEKFENAQILVAEGFEDEAKDLLREILIAESNHVGARKKLDEIQAGELSRILSDRETPVRKPKWRDTGRAGKDPQDSGGHSRRATDQPNAVKIEDPIRDSEAALKKLDLDLGLGLGLDREGGADQSAFYGQSEDLKTFGAELEKQLQSASPRDRMDIGIGFLEMGLMDLAIHQFKSAQRAPELRSAATGLWAYSLILSGRPFDASQTLEPMLSDTELGAEEKIDLYYLMARAQERLGRVGYAADWYNQVLELDPAYRDVRDRLRSLPRPSPSGQDA